MNSPLVILLMIRLFIIPLCSDNVILIAPDFTKSPVTKKLAEILNNDAGVKGSDIRCKIF